jgi:ectoine hydroxylase-related dioxygenase (phytanoyl-CoA dioxygenase family)
MKSYGITSVSQVTTQAELILEAVHIRGYAVVESLLSVQDAEKLCKMVTDIYQQQCEEIPEASLIRIKEQQLVRAPLLYDQAFAALACHPFVMEIMALGLGKTFTMHLQNAVINTPTEHHHQGSWHRDLPYQNFVSDIPLALNAFFCLSPFSKKNGATILLPFSHHLGYLPSLPYIEENKIQIEAPAGSVVFFNSMLFHCAGINYSDQIRIGINHVYTTPIIRQQIDLPVALNGQYADSTPEAMVFGYPFSSAYSVKDYRQQRLDRIK